MTFKTADLCDDFFDNDSVELQIASPGLRDFGGRRAFAGQVVSLKLFEDNSLVRELVATNGEGRVLVVDGGGSLRCAVLGDMLAEQAVANHWNGLIINACIRDAAQIAGMDLGVKALATHPLKTVKRGIGERDIPVSFCNVTFHPGDYVYADMDGIIVANRSLLQ